MTSIPRDPKAARFPAAKLDWTEAELDELHAALQGRGADGERIAPTHPRDPAATAPAGRRTPHGFRFAD